MRETLLLTNGRIFRSAQDNAPASAILLEDGTISWLGDKSEAPRSPSTQVIDLEGRTVLPGLTDSHIHVFMLALGRLQVSFAETPVTSFSEISDELAKAQSSQVIGSWLQGCDLMEDRLQENRLPNRRDLDEFFPRTPVLLRRYCGHTAIMNSAAMEALNLKPDSPENETPGFRMFDDGSLSGIADEAAAEWVFSRAPVPPIADMTAAIHQVLSDCVALGLTAVTEAAVGFSIGYDREADIWATYCKTHRPPLRVGFMLQLDPTSAASRKLRPTADPFWSHDTLKFFADGIIGGRTGALTEPYEDVDSSGVLLHSEGELETLVKEAHGNGWRIAIHATGDLAIARVQKALVAAQADDASRRHRIEHCFVPPPGVFSMLAQANIATVMQPSFLLRMGSSIVHGLGSRTQTAYPGASVTSAGAILALSSDAPTGCFSPWIGVKAAVDRAYSDGTVIGRREALSRQDALHAYIFGGAQVMRHDDFRGTLEPGMDADLTVLSSCPFSCNIEQLPSIRSDLTIVNGRMVHCRIP